MTPLGWAFMILSVGFVTGLALWCYYRVLTMPEDPGGGSDGSDGA